jgi:hypothetical protein
LYHLSSITLPGDRTVSRSKIGSLQAAVMPDH